jgi:uncharacterized protein involved in tolerance to divalent cations
MVNVIIYLQNLNEAKELISELLLEGLVAHASIDHENDSYKLVDGAVTKEVNFVITAQTKALLFSEIDSLIKKKLGDQVPIYSLPITQANDSFDRWIRANTRKI